MTYRDENIRYLRPLWVRAGVIYSLLIVIITATGVVVDETSVPLLGLAVGVAAVIAMRMRRRALARRAMQLPTPDAAARALLGPLAARLGRSARPFLVTGTANIHVVYGGLARAEELLASIDWSDKPPLLRGDAQFVRAMIDYVRGDYAAGLAKAREVPQLIEVPTLAPGAKTLRRSGAMLCDIGLALAEHDVAAIERLRQAQSFKRHVTMRAVAAWALWKIGDADAERWLAVSRALIPYAYGLGVPRPAAPVAAAAPDRANPYAAPAADVSADRPYDPMSEAKRYTWVRVGVWLALVAMFAAIYWLLGVRHR